jgi:tetratricopeptide (TPR) repeat protein
VNKNLAEAYFENGEDALIERNYEMALKNFNEAIKIEKKINESTILKAYFDSGIVYFQMAVMGTDTVSVENNYRNALEYFHIVITETDNKEEYKDMFISAYIEYGVTYFRLNQYGEALNNFNYIIKRFEPLNNSRVYYRRTETYEMIGEIEKAKQDKIYAKQIESQFQQ